MKVLINRRYILNAPWHKNHNTIVEIIKRDIGITDAYKGRRVFFIGTNLDTGDYYEDFDTEFISDDFRNIEIDDDKLRELVIASFTSVINERRISGNIKTAPEDLDEIRQEALILTLRKLELMSIEVVEDDF